MLRNMSLESIEIQVNLKQMNVIFVEYLLTV